VSAGTLLVVGVKNLGRSIALHFARRGWNVAVASRTEADVEALARDVDTAGGRGLPIVCDLADTQSCAELVARAQARFGRIDLCVAAQTSGARFGPVPLLEVSEDDLRRAFFGYPVNTLHLLQALSRALLEQGAGTFVQIGTSSGLRTKEGFAALGAAQHALRALVQVAARELRPRGVHVAYLAVEGQIDSDKSQAYVARHGLEKTLPPSEIARAVEFLHAQEARSWTHELSLKPSQTDW
jgi:NAD(P)-dependent dehydrogenase (short-subunit alcohol dehydrogenase family)